METLFKPPVNDQGTEQLIPESYTQSPTNIHKLSIIIPVYNEEKTISLILDRINEVKLIPSWQQKFYHLDNFGCSILKETCFF